MIQYIVYGGLMVHWCIIGTPRF